MKYRHQNEISRRSLLTGTAAAAGGTLAASWATAAPPAEARAAIKTYQSSDFYDASGNFLEDKARAAYYEMFTRFGYPITDTIKAEMWILDFGLGDFAHVGMAGILWINRQDYCYFGHEIYLLPGQMIPEHKHLATQKGPAKMESWQPRKGRIYTFGEGEPSTDQLARIPQSQRDLVHSRACKPLGIDQLGDLNRREAWHFMVAGPEGALVTEYGTFHDMDGLRFSNPAARLANSGATS